MSGQYTEVTAITDLPSSHFLYEANCDLHCASCNNVIPVGSFFARKLISGSKKPLPHCRECKPVKIYTSPQRTGVAASHDEYLYVSSE